MKTTLKIAWRNIWRNPRRSWVLITTVAVAVIGYVGTTSFTRGFMYEMVNSAIRYYGGHIQIIPEGYDTKPNIQLRLSHPDRMAEALARVPGIHFAPLVTFKGMASSSEASGGVVINGIDPQKERQVTIVSEKIIAGDYFESETANAAVIGEELAERLNVRLGEKIILMASALDQNIASGAFRVVGIFRTVSTDFDRAFVFIRLDDAQKLIGYQDEITAFSIHLQQGYDLQQTVERLRETLPPGDFKIQTWRERNPVLVLSLEVYEYFIFLFLLIIVTAVAFTIVNSFLMVIYERIREFGVMMAMGVLPKRIRRMLYWETLFLTLIGSTVGIVLSYLIFGYWRRHGLDLSATSDALGKLGISTVIYPEILMSDLLIGLGVIVSLTWIAVLYPAYKASRFHVVDALNFV